VRQSDHVTIELAEEVPDTMDRIALLNAALFRVLTGVTLIEILEADYMAGRIRLLVESRNIRPQVTGRVCVKYEPASSATRRRHPHLAAFRRRSALR